MLCDKPVWDHTSAEDIEFQSTKSIAKPSTTRVAKSSKEDNQNRQKTQAKAPLAETVRIGKFKMN